MLMIAKGEDGVRNHQESESSESRVRKHEETMRPGGTGFS